MGLWGKMFGGVLDAYPGACNAVLAEHALSVMSAPDRREVLDAIIPLVMTGSPGITRQSAVSIFTGAGRPAQLNFVALVMAQLEMVPRLPKELWFSITNPFVSCIDSPSFREKIEQISEQMYKKHGVRIHVTERSLDLGVGGVLLKHAMEEDEKTFVLGFLNEHKRFLSNDCVVAADRLFYELKQDPKLGNITLAAAVEFVFLRASGEIPA